MRVNFSLLKKPWSRFCLPRWRKWRREKPLYKSLGEKKLLILKIFQRAHIEKLFCRAVCVLLPLHAIKLFLGSKTFQMGMCDGASVVRIWHSSCLSWLNTTDACPSSTPFLSDISKYLWSILQGCIWGCRILRQTATDTMTRSFSPIWEQHFRLWKIPKEES